MTDFSPASQDSYAMNSIKAWKAADNIEKGNLGAAISKLHREWTSLPGGTEPRITLETARKLFRKYGGVLEGE